jgi:hypothetical protein
LVPQSSGLTFVETVYQSQGRVKHTHRDWKNNKPIYELDVSHYFDSIDDNATDAETELAIEQAEAYGKNVDAGHPDEEE